MAEDSASTALSAMCFGSAGFGWSNALLEAVQSSKLIIAVKLLYVYGPPSF